MQTGELTSLHPLSALPHPILTKAVSSFGDGPTEDNCVGPIASSTKLRLLEIKVGQWRGGVWHDRELDVCWVLVAGLAKGVLSALREVCNGGESRFELQHPASQLGLMATVTIAVGKVREDGYEADEIDVDIVPESRHAGSNLFWQATVRVLTTPAAAGLGPVQGLLQQHR